MAKNILKFALVFIGGLLAASFLTSKTFEAEITIAAPPEKVWAVLMDTKSYPEWNPTFVAVSPPYALGAKISSRVKKPDGAFIDMRPTVKTLRVNRELGQAGGVPGILTYHHNGCLSRWRVARMCVKLMSTAVAFCGFGIQLGRTGLSARQ